MNKVKLEIAGLSYSQTQSGAYALVLVESGGKRSIPIIIGGYEAQAIAIELEKMKPNRPLTHDLFKTFAESFGVKVIEVVIYNLNEGIFHSKLICEKEGQFSEIDARTSDAIALSLRFKCPIYTFESILSSAGTNLDESNDISTELSEEELIEEDANPMNNLNIDELRKLLQDAIDDEDYEKASKIRDELKKRNLP
ncbi:MAG: bifunctional nuclease family protein [Flavobacteriia bacterium]|nr:bifunctional nuclease family protein [Flavobacteriia bacterium]